MTGPDVRSDVFIAWLVAMLGHSIMTLWLTHGISRQPAIWSARRIALRYGPGVRGFAFLLAAVPLVIALLAMLDTENLWHWGRSGWILFCLLYNGANWLLYSQLVRFSLVIAQEGLEWRSSWRAKRFVPWEEIVHLSYNKRCKWFIIRLWSGEEFHVPLSVPGQLQFLEEMERRLPAEAFIKAREGYRRLDRRLPVLLPAKPEQKWGELHDGNPFDPLTKEALADKVKINDGYSA